MTVSQAAFSYLALGSVVCALIAVTRRNPVHSVLWVLALFLHVAGIYLLVGAEFLAATQVIVYAGAILVFYLIVVMLLDLPEEESSGRFSRLAPAGFAAAGFLGALLVRVGVIGAADLGPSHAASAPSMDVLGRALFSEFALPFEIASLVLLAAIVGAVALGRKKAAE